MMRLTNHDDQGNWSLKGVKWENLYEGAVIDKKTYERLYTALWRLKDYEDTGLDPDRIEELKEENDWIPVEERLPEEKEWRGHNEEECCAYMKRMEVAYMTDTLEYTFGYFDGYKWMDKWYDIIKNVVAWKTHEPYIPKGEDN